MFELGCFGFSGLRIRNGEKNMRNEEISSRVCEEEGGEEKAKILMLLAYFRKRLDHTQKLLEPVPVIGFFAGLFSRFSCLDFS